MKIWKYQRGNQWEEIELPIVLNENDNWEDVLKQNGYEKRYMFGHNYEEEINVWVKGWPSEEFIVDFSISVDCYERVFCKEFPDFLMFLKDIALPLMESMTNADRLHFLEKTINRAFEAWHGHAPSDPCVSCDRAEIYRQREMAKVREKNKNKPQTSIVKKGE